MNKVFFFIIITLLLFSCKNKKAIIKNFEAEGFVKATVIKYEVESCGYLIRLENELLLSPDSLPKAYEKNNFLVWIKYNNTKKQSLSTCMAGKTINLIEILER